MEPDEPRTLILVLCDEIERLRAEHRLMEQVIDDAHGELDYLAPGTNGLEHDLIERLVSIRDDQEHHDG